MKSVGTGTDLIVQLCLTVHLSAALTKSWTTPFLAWLIQPVGHPVAPMSGSVRPPVANTYAT
jgi:hypothetical protein